MDILLIDDDFRIHHIVRDFLRRFGKENNITVNLKSIFDPVQGIFELSKAGEYFDIVALDVRMPRLPGDDIYNFLMHEKPHLLEDVLFVTGYREDLETRFPDQKMHVLDKPFRYNQFAESLVGITG